MAPELLVGPATLIAATTPLVWSSWHLAECYVETTLSRWSLTSFLVVAEISLILQLLGALSLWRRVPLLIGAWLFAMLLFLLTRILSRHSHPRPLEPEGLAEGEDLAFPRWIKWLTIAPPTLFAVSALVSALAIPDTGVDAMLYHRHMLAYWLQHGTFWKIPVLESGFVYEGGIWSSGDLFSLWPAIAYGRDYLSQLSSLIWAIAAWLGTCSIACSVGIRRWTSAMLATAIIVTPATLNFQLSFMHVDLFTVMMIVMMAWCTLQWRAAPTRAGWLIFAGVAGGLAISSKQTVAVYVIVWLSTLLVTAARKRGWRAAALVVFAGAAPVVIWPVRAWIAAGQPFWPASLGPFTGPEAPALPLALQSLAGAVLDRGPVIVIGLAALVFTAFTGVWFPLAVARARTLWKWASQHRLLIYTYGAMAGAILGWIVAPTTAMGLTAGPRYIAGPLAVFFVFLGAAVLASPHGSLNRKRALIAGNIVPMSLGVAIFYVYDLHRWPWYAWVLGLAAAVTAAAIYGSKEPPQLRITASVQRWARVLGGLALCGVIWVAGPVKAANWYPQIDRLPELAYVSKWLQSEQISGATIAYAGLYVPQLPGRDLSNHIYWVAKPAPHHGFQVWGSDDLGEWERALQQACVDYLVVGQVKDGWSSRAVPEWDLAKRSAIMRRVVEPEPGLDVAIYEVDHSRPDSGCVEPSADS